MGTTTEVLAVYGKDYYKGAPVITKNTYGAGTAYHIAANCEDALIEELCKQLVVDAQITDILGDVFTMRQNASLFQSHRKMRRKSI